MSVDYDEEEIMKLICKKCDSKIIVEPTDDKFTCPVCNAQYVVNFNLKKEIFYFSAFVVLIKIIDIFISELMNSLNFHAMLTGFVRVGARILIIWGALKWAREVAITLIQD